MVAIRNDDHWMFRGEHGSSSSYWLVNGYKSREQAETFRKHFDKEYKTLIVEVQDPSTTPFLVKMNANVSDNKTDINNYLDRLYIAQARVRKIKDHLAE